MLAAVDAALAASSSPCAAPRARPWRELTEPSRRGPGACLTSCVESAPARSRRTVRERLRKRAAQLEQETGVLDEARLHQEVVMAADRLDVTEELVRLGSHGEQFQAALAGAEAGTGGRPPPGVPAPGDGARGEYHRLQGQRRVGRPTGWST